MKRIVLAGMVAVLSLSGCAVLRQIIPTVERPTARVDSVRLTRLSFTDAELTTSVAIDNPNAIGISLTGLSYALDVEGVRFLAGEQERGLAIEAFGESIVQLPLNLVFANLVETIGAVRELDEAAYAVELALMFDLPILGSVTLPLRREGTFPIVRRPTIRVTSLELESINLSGARLVLGFEVANPNVFAFDVEELGYAFSVGDRVWADGALDQPRTVPANGATEVTASFGVSFSAFGRTVRDLLLGDDAIAYSFAANARVNPQIDLIPTVELPFTRSGEIPVRRR